MTPIFLIQLCGVFFASCVFYRAEKILANMPNRGMLAMRLSILCTAVGSAGFVLQVLQGFVPPVPALLLLAGVAIFLFERCAIDKFKASNRGN
jgi:CHASE2 domain-containing sensor protein